MDMLIEIHQNVNKTKSSPKMGLSVVCLGGFASCKTFGKQLKRPCFRRSPQIGLRSFVGFASMQNLCANAIKHPCLGEGR